MAWPLILSNATVPLLGLTDTTVVGHLPAPHHLSAVAAGSTAFNVVHFAFVFLRMGTTGLVAQAFGTGDGQAVRDLLARGIALALMLGLLLLLAGPLLILVASLLFGTSPELDSELRTYLQIRFFGIPASFTSLVVLGWLLGLQDARSPMVMMVLTNGLNIALDVLFVVGFGMAASGVALATVLAEHAGLAIGILLVRRRLRRIEGAPTPIRRLLRQGGFGRMIRVNRDIFIRSLALQAGFLSFAAIGARLGDVTLAANAILLNLQTLAAFGLDGFAHAAEAMVGRQVGARDRAGIRAAVRANAELALVLALALALGFALAGELLIHAMTTIETVRAGAGRHLPWMIASPLVSIWAFLFDGVFIGATRTAVMRDGMILAFVVFA
ncbi:MAG: MATE family efflux transporter, partial [Geminicoccaceae bacterium]|nr:MATE family efflux transporter [Geminicoccaceae bacterium]